MDRNRVSREYWESRPFHSDDNGDLNTNTNTNTGGDDASLMVSLFEKGSLEELNMLVSVLVKGNSTADWTQLQTLVSEEIQKRKT